MIVDVHSHAWLYPEHFGEGFREQAQRARGHKEVDLSTDFERYSDAAPADTVAIVFGGKARLSGLWVDDRYVAEYVALHSPRVIGFLSVDPTQRGWETEMREGHEALGLQGIKLLPMYAGFRPDDRALDALWSYAEKNRLPVILHSGTTFISQAPLECTMPRWVDNVAIRFPDVRIVLGHLGHPFENETVAVIRKHPNVYADVSALFYRPYQLYNSLMLVQEYGVWGKVLFGSDYPFSTVNESVSGLRSLNEMLTGTALPRLNRAELEAMIHRDSLSLLGLNLP